MAFHGLFGAMWWAFMVFGVFRYSTLCQGANARVGNAQYNLRTLHRRSLTLSRYLLHDYRSFNFSLIKMSRGWRISGC